HLSAFQECQVVVITYCYVISNLPSPKSKLHFPTLHHTFISIFYVNSCFTR
ncbi:hypothetical protein L9F63_005449, partial [Diploptera punctata]